MPWNTFWLLFIQAALALSLLAPFVAFFVWLGFGAFFARRWEYSPQRMDFVKTETERSKTGE